MKNRYFVDADKLLLKALRKKVSPNKDILRKAIKLRLLKELVKTDGASINKSLVLLRMFPNE